MRIKLIVVFLVCALSQTVTAQVTKAIKLVNNSGFDRTDELIVVGRAQLEKKLGEKIGNRYVLINAKEGSPVVVQYDDLDGDDKWDELVFLSSFKASETKVVKLTLSDRPATVKAVVRAHVRHRKKNADNSFGSLLSKDTMPYRNAPTNFNVNPLPPYLTEGPAWENDKIAFRHYFDTRNGKDVFGKIVPGMVMDSIGQSTNNSYHALSNWGMDVLHVGKSLGAGALAIATKDLSGKDTLIRVGGPDVKRQTFEVVADGPVRAIFRLTYDWVINSKPVQIIDETSIWGGQYFYESKVTAIGSPAGASLVTGFADFYNNTPGQIKTAGTRVFYSYGSQSENKDNLGLAVAIPSSGFVKYERVGVKPSDIQESYLVAQKIIPNKPVTYRFYAGWEKADPRFQQAKTFADFLRREAVLRDTAIKVSL